MLQIRQHAFSFPETDSRLHQVAVEKSNLNIFFTPLALIPSPIGPAEIRQGKGSDLQRFATYHTNHIISLTSERSPTRLHFTLPRHYIDNILSSNEKRIQNFILLPLQY